MIVIGGIPRSGTTALARLLDQHPEVSIFGTETNILPEITSLAEVPLDLIDKDRLVARLFKSLSLACLQMRDWNQTTFNLRDSMRDPTATQVENLAHEIGEILMTADIRARNSLVLQAMQEFLSKLSSTSIFGEKSPANISMLPSLGSDSCGHLWIMTYRHPFEVIQSMQQRSTSADPWAQKFHGAVEVNIGNYLAGARHLQSCGRLLQDHDATFFKVSYDELVTHTVQTGRSIVDKLGLSSNPEFERGILTFVGASTRLSNPSSPFSRSDIWKIEALLSEHFSGSYEPSKRGSMLEAIEYQEVSEKRAVLRGVIGAGNSENGLIWCAKSTLLALYVHRETTEAVVELAYLIPRVLKDAPPTNRVAVWFVDAAGQEYPAASGVELSAFGSQLIPIPLDPTKARGFDGSLAVYLVKFVASVEIVNAIVRGGNLDERNLSFSISPVVR